MRRFKKAFAVIGMIAVLLCMGLLTGCDSVSVASDLVLNQDGTGSRKITGTITPGIKNTEGTNQPDGYGSAYDYFKIHGSELQTYITNAYTTAIPESADWLTVTVTDNTNGGTTGQETIELSFTFTSFADYTEKLGKLAKFGDDTAAYTAPTLVSNADGSVTYTEADSVQKSVYKALQKHVMEDDTVFDSTANGGNTGASEDQLLQYGVEDDKTAPMKIKIGQSKVVTVMSDKGNYTVTAKYDGSGEATEPKETELVLDYSFNDTLNNAGTLGADGNLTLGTGSSQTAATYVDGIDGKAYQFDGTSYLASVNRTFAYDELTVSFYYKMDEYFTTDTGANMVIVPAGLGAIAGGVIDLEFIKDPDADVDGVQFLVKMNSANWMVQDKLFTEKTVDLGEWHCYTVVFQNVYDDAGSMEAAYVNLYVDGERTERMELSQAAGLKYMLGKYDESETNANGGFNVGGYYEAEQVKRGLKGALDNLKVFDGALSAAEVKEKCYTVAVNNGGNTQTPPTTTTEKPEEKGCGCGSTVAATASVAAGVVLLAGAFVAIVFKRKNKKENA